MRGVAVLGIVAINVYTFWGPSVAAISPHLPERSGPLAVAQFAAVFVLIEGKMRALFTILFGAGLALFAQDRPAGLQVRRLLWLGAIGALHFFLLWTGDILFSYAAIGLVALAFVRLPALSLLALALPLFLVWHALFGLGMVPAVLDEARVRIGGAEIASYDGALARIAAEMAHERAVIDAGFLEAARLRLSHEGAAAPFRSVWLILGETLPLMLIGMALHHTGFFAGRWSARALRRVAIAGIGLGGVGTLALLAALAARDFPPMAMIAATGYWAAPLHLAMAIGYAAALVLAWPRLAETRLGRGLAAAGRTAFTNYLGTTIVMMALFSGWGLGLAEVLPRETLPLLVLATWAVMIAWSALWLERCRYGPFEWAWRSLTRGAPAPMRR